MVDIDLGHLPSQQEEMWHLLFDFAERMSGSWTIVGGQMVYLHCVERGADMGRTTSDVDALLDVRTDSRMFSRADAVLRHQLGFESLPGIGGVQHRWTKGVVQFDVLIPEVSRGIAESAVSATGGVAVQSPGANQALARSEPLSVKAGERAGTVFRPSLQGAIISKAAAYTVPSDSRKTRHLRDIAILLGVARGDDRLYDDLSLSDLRHLRKLSALLSDDKRSTQRDLDEQSMLRIESFLDVALSLDPKPKLPPPAAISPMASEQPKGGECGAATATGIPCRNPRGSCPHHH